MAIAGGALVYLQGKAADAYGLQQSFLITAFCELYVLFYALWGSRATPVSAPAEPPVR
jgi:FHS family L-fucose permease-like MFS transporter